MLGFKSLPRVPTIPFLVGTLKTIPYTTKSDGTNTYTTKSDGTFSGFGSSTWAAPWDSYEFVGGTFDSACTESYESGLVSVVWGYWEQDTGSTGEVMPVYLRCEYSEYGISDDLSKQGAKSRYKFTPPLAEVSAAVAAGGVYKCPRTLGVSEGGDRFVSGQWLSPVAERYVCIEGCGLQARCGGDTVAIDVIIVLLILIGFPVAAMFSHSKGFITLPPALAGPVDRLQGALPAWCCCTCCCCAFCLGKRRKDEEEEEKKETKTEVTIVISSDQVAPGEVSENTEAAAAINTTDVVVHDGKNDETTLDDEEVEAAAAEDTTPASAKD